MTALLEVDDLNISFPGEDGLKRAVKGVSFNLHKGETVALVGESGSGKSVTALSTVKLLPDSAEVSGSVRYSGTEMIGADQSTLRRVRGNDVSFIFQEPMTSLNPLHSIERQIGESLELHQGLSGQVARDRILELLHQVGIHEPESRLRSFPHELSGGQRQRVMIAMALANGPELLIADEPTTALDVTIEAQILDLLADLKSKHNMGLLFITHDLGVVRKIADRVCVMKDGEIVEQGKTEDIFSNPKHDYTKMLLAAEPKGAPDPVPEGAKEVVSTDKLRVWFPIQRGFLRRTVGHIKAVNAATLSVRSGETLGIVGESGSGKTTLALAIMRLISSEGPIQFMDRNIQGLKSSELRPLRKDMQMVFQDPFGSLSPRMTIEEIVSEGLGVHGNHSSEDKRAMVNDILREVELPGDILQRYPHEFSGGQRQRIAIARAMVLKPKLVLLDEPTSALDMTVQVQIVELLKDLQKKFGLAYLFISHDLRVVKALSHKILVMKRGDIVEAGPAEQVFASPQSAYTQQLLSAVFDESQTQSANSDTL